MRINIGTSRFVRVLKASGRNDGEQARGHAVGNEATYLPFFAIKLTGSTPSNFFIGHLLPLTCTGSARFAAML